MQANPMPRRLRADAAVQRAVMALCLAPYPHWRTIPELAREIGCGDAVERAVQNLIRVGLLERRGASVRPTRAAARLERLELP
jgi:predicted transcriptional regulator